MSSVYPSSLDSLPASHIDDVGEKIQAAFVNDLADAVNKIEAELGVIPSSAFATVAERIAAIQAGLGVITTVAGTSYAALTTDEVILCTNAGSVTVTLPTAVGVTGKHYTATKLSATENSWLTLATTGGQTINGVSTYRFDTPWQTVTVVSDGANWLIVRSEVTHANTVRRGNVAYVSKNGSDSNTGESWDRAYLTIQAAIDAGEDDDTIRVGQGTFTETVTLDGNARKLIGTGWEFGRGTVIRAPSNTADCLVVTGSHCEIRDVLTCGAGAAWTGRGILLDSGNHCFIRKWKHINDSLTPTSETELGTAIYLTSNTEGNSIRDFRISDCGIGIHSHQCSSSEFTNCNFSRAFKALQIDNYVGNGGLSFRNLKATASPIRSSAEDSVLISVGTNTFIQCDFSEGGSLDTYRIANSTAGGPSGSTFIGGAVAPFTQMIIDGDDNTFIEMWIQNGLTVNGDRNTFINCTVNAGPPGILFAGDHNRFEGDIGIFAVSGHYNYFRAKGGSGLTATVTGDYNVLDNLIKTSGGTPTVTLTGNSIVRRNNARGTATILNGTTAIAVTHSLGAIPRAEQINLEFTENPTNDPGNTWVSAIGATTFTVNCRNDPGASNLDFSWAIV